MCYFVEINLPRKELEKHYGVNMPEDPRYTPGYFHSAFTKPYLPVITNHKPGEIQLFRWGLIPSWVKSKEAADKILRGTFNARAETVWEKPSFRIPVRSKRCLVPAHGFFEWHTDGDNKTPYYIKKKDGEIFSFAGLYDVWTDPDTGEILHTFSILTVKANQMMEKIHNLKKRMPVILHPASEKLWISNKLETNELSALLKPIADEQLIAWPVSGKKLHQVSDITDPSIIDPLKGL